MTLHPEMPLWLQDMGSAYAPRMSPQTSAFNTPSKFVRAYNGKEPYKNGSKMPLSAGTTSLGRPSSGRREFMSSVNATAAAGVSPGSVAGLSEVKRVHVGMRKGDRICPDCDGFVWSSKAECESDKCQHKRKVEATTPSRVMEHKASGFYTTQVANERAELKGTQVANERAELRVISIVCEDCADTSWSTDISPVAVYTRSGEQTELKRARGVRHPTYQCEILQGQRPVWKDDRCTWEFTQQKPSSGLDTTVESTTQVWGDV